MDRKKFITYLGSASLTGFIGGCKDFLDVVPKEIATERDEFNSIDSLDKFIRSCYAYMPNPSNATQSLDLFTADDVTTCFPVPCQKFTHGNYSASNPIISHWSKLYKGIRQSYILINNAHKTPEASSKKIKDSIAQGKFLVGYFNSLLIKMYGPIIIQKGVPDLQIDFKNSPRRSSLDNCVKFTANILEEAAKDLPAKRTGSEFGLATSVAAKAIKARLLLYNASPLFNGGGEKKESLYDGFTNANGEQLIPTKYDKEKWGKAAEAIKEAINAAESAGYHLYHNNTSVNSALPSNSIEKDLRFTFIDRNNNEVLFGYIHPEGHFAFQNRSEPYYPGQSFNGVAPSLSMIESFYTENGLPIDMDPNFDFNSRYSVVDGQNGKTLSLNLNRSPRFRAWICYHNSYYEIKNGNKNKILCRFRKNDEFGLNNGNTNYSPTGYLNKKGVAPMNNYKKHKNYQYPWPIIRLGGLYLDYAEALIEHGQDFGKAKKYIDKVRKRAGIPTIDESWAPIGGASDKKTLRSIVRQERTNELYLENERFWDLRRWMEAKGPLDTDIKGMNPKGATNKDFFQVTTYSYSTNFNSPGNYLMPIPIGEINKNEGLVQNPGY